MSKDDTQQVWHAWYSDKYVRSGLPLCVWRTKDGQDILVCEVTNTKKSSLLYDDVKYCGEVVEFVRDVSITWLFARSFEHI